jgi:hypothetical protein
VTHAPPMTLRRQQTFHDPILIRLSVSSHFLMSALPKVSILSGRQLSDTEGGLHINRIGNLT